MAVAEASFRTSIDTMSEGLMLERGLLFSSLVAASTTTPSMTKMGWLLALSELIPRMRMDVEAPG